MRFPIRVVTAVVAVLVTTAAPGPAPTTAQEDRLRQPLPLEVVTSLRSHNGRSTLEFSPDGEWILHNVETADHVPRDGGRFASTGFPFAEGNSRKEVTLTHRRSGETVSLGGPRSSSWAPAFSPDGEKIAFYSDEGGEAGLWVWAVGEDIPERVPAGIVRPFFGFEKPGWSPDGAKLAIKLLPTGMTLEEANGMGPGGSASPADPSPEVAPEEPTVSVRRVEPAEDAGGAEPEESAPADPSVQLPPIGDVSRGLVDLAVIDVATHQVRRILEREAVRYHAFSPDGERLAYSIQTGNEPNTQQPNYDLGVVDLDTGQQRLLGRNLRLGYGIEWSWSPDGRHIAYLPSGQMARLAAEVGGTERFVLVDVTDGSTRVLSSTEAPTFDPGDGELPPFWSPDGTSIYGIGDGSLWRADVASGEISALAAVPDWEFRTLVADRPSARAWSTDDGSTIWAIARERGGARSAIWAIDARSGEVRRVWTEDKTYLGVFNVAGSRAHDEIAFVSTGFKTPFEIWVLDTESAAARQASHLNPEFERYELGTAQVIEWESADGEPLRGALLLPPGYEPGTRLPLMVSVYGGSMGSRAVTRFGGEMGSVPLFNMHVLTTRGFAVLFPDAPIRVGTPVRDLMATVMPGVDAAIAGGWAAPDRMAIMGQSYGAYNALAMITRTDRFRAAVLTAAVIHPELAADYVGGPGYYEQGQGNMGGTIWEYPERYRENSPLFDFDRIRTPVLIGQGANDGDLVAPEAVFSALERLGKPVEYRLYQGEGHVITHAVNVIDFWRARFEFLAEHLDLHPDASGRFHTEPAP